MLECARTPTNEIKYNSKKKRKRKRANRPVSRSLRRFVIAFCVRVYQNKWRKMAWNVKKWHSSFTGPHHAVIEQLFIIPHVLGATCPISRKDEIISKYYYIVSTLIQWVTKLFISQLQTSKDWYLFLDGIFCEIIIYIRILLKDFNKSFILLQNLKFGN